MRATNHHHWIILGLMSFWLLTFAITFQSIPPILGILVNTLGISHAQAGALMGLFVIPAIFLALPGGVLSDRYGARLVGGVSLLVMSLGIAIVALSSSYWVLGLGRLIAGMGAVMVQIIGARGVTSWFRGREIGLAMGIFNTAVPLGTILSLNFTGVVALRFGWQVPIWIDFAISLIALALFLGLYGQRNSARAASANRSPSPAPLKNLGLGIWLVGLTWALFNAALVSFFTYAPDYFIAQGENPSRAGLLASYPMWGSLFLAPIAGFMIDRIGGKGLFVLVGCSGIAVLLFLMPGTSAAATLAIIIGLFAAIATPAIFSLPADLLTKEVTGVGFGIMVAAVGVGTSLGTYVAGSLRDATGDYLWSFRAMAAFAALGVVPMILLSQRSARKPRLPSGR